MCVFVSACHLGVYVCAERSLGEGNLAVQSQSGVTAVVSSLKSLASALYTALGVRDPLSSRTRNAGGAEGLGVVSFKMNGTVFTGSVIDLESSTGVMSEESEQFQNPIEWISKLEDALEEEKYQSLR